MIMKELSTEEKAARYDKAIERANELNYVSDKDSLQRKTIEHLFPELRESEDKDEKIREMLIAFVKNDCIIASNKNKQDAIAWLEKQGEQKPNTIFLKFRIGDKVTNGENIYTINYIGKDRYWVKEHDCITIPFEYQHNWKLVEQKLTDNEMKILLQTEYEKGKADVIESTMKAVTKDKESAIKFLKSAGIINDNGELTKEYIVDKIEQTSNWSEDDEKAVRVLMNIIKKSEIIDHLIYTDLLKEKLYNWLKLLKERYAWKPSNEQIEALNFTIKSLDNMFTATWYMDNYTKLRLEEILEALKKLKGK